VQKKQNTNTEEIGTLKKIVIKTNKAPSAIGPYSQAVKAGGFMFLSGQIPVEPKSGNVVGKSISEQTRCVMKNISEVLKEISLDFSSIVQVTVYLRDMSHFAEFNSVYGGYFSSEPPARACVEVTRLPKDVLVEIVAVALTE